MRLPHILCVALFLGHFFNHYGCALCNCGVALGKTIVRGEYSSGKTILVRIGCNDEQMKTECFAAKREMEDFVKSIMEYIDDIYIRPSMDLINRLFVADKLTKQQYDALREALVRQRNTASESVEDRLHPDCASGLWTESLYNRNTDLQNTYRDWKRWDLNQIRDNALCISRHLETELLKLQAENKVDREISMDNGPFSSELNGVIRVELGQDELKGLTPYTKRIMERIVQRRDDTGDDIAGLGITTGKDFVHYFLLRAIVEPPDIRLPASELSLEDQFDQGDLGDENIECFPLNSSVIVAQGNTSQGIYTVKQLADLRLDDVVVTGVETTALTPNQPYPQHGVQVSPIVDFAHRMDESVSRFLNVAYYIKGPASIKTVAASPNHNILFGIYNEKTGIIDEYYKTFGVLKHHFGHGSSVYIKSGHQEWLSIQKVFFSDVDGFVAPITRQGLMAIVPDETLAAVSSHKLDGRSIVLDAGQVHDILSQAAQVSCYSTVPDTVGSLIATAKRLLWGASSNQDGAGVGRVLDGLASLGHRLSQWAGHLA